MLFAFNDQQKITKKKKLNQYSKLNKIKIYVKYGIAENKNTNIRQYSFISNNKN